MLKVVNHKQTDDDITPTMHCETRVEKQNNITMPKLRPHEKAFIVSHIDPSITVGYKYSVRKNGSKEYLFDGKPMHLEAITKCKPGVELQFESNNSICSVKYNGSSLRYGYALAISILEEGMNFKIYNKDDDKIGTCKITSVSREQQILSSVKGHEPNFIDFKEIQVNFKCLFIFQDKTFETDVSGILNSMKRPGERAIIKKIEALLLPAGEMFILLP